MGERAVWVRENCDDSLIMGEDKAQYQECC